LDPTERPASARASGMRTFFSDLMVAHEVAHQWWGNVVTADGYKDEWMPEALANYSAMLWLEKTKGPKALEELLASYRDDLTNTAGGGRSVESAGPLTWGYRLEADPEPEAWRLITYEKGAWVFHMLRQRLGSENFLKMLAELRRRYQFRAVSTADLLSLAKEFRPPRVTAESLNAFFDTWVYSTGIPALSVSYTVKGMTLSGRVEQTGVGKDFSVDIPVEIQFATGAPQIVWVRTGAGSTVFSATLKRVPLRAVIPTGTAVLATRG
ncbi:MAG: M1 family metallopeptidase, partial [Bryobacteraceae bacterium]